ncbi:MAG TPA: lysylphosphatidylglycerol synthase transmembrane domain-containing protein [Candidatus Polarisedimenticolia bacterium]|nr:lysylphosphatidylglycerol synthase transmembrane domain-containing protein [Candidatus Polarisedimenticolia bacterium]
MKSTTRILISLGLTVLFLALFFRSFDLQAAGRAIASASPVFLLLGVVLNLLAYLVRAWRWRHLLAPMREGLGLYNLTSTTFIGFMVTFLVPMRIGEIVRPVLLARREKIPATGAIATVALERIFDAMTVMTLFLVFSLSAHGRAVLNPAEVGSAQASAAHLLRQGALAAALLVAVGLPVALVLVMWPQVVVGWLHRLNRGGPESRLGRAVVLLEEFLTGLGSLRRGRELGKIIASSLAMWLTIDLSVWCTLKAFGTDLPQPLQFFDIFLLMVALTVGISVPTPGGVGPYEYFCTLALTDLWAVPAAVAGAVALTLHATAMLPTIVIGLLLMWRDGVRPAEMRGLAAEETS